jgi:hypothetical protein
MHDKIELQAKNLGYETAAIQTSSQAFLLKCAKISAEVANLNSLNQPSS